MSKVKVLIVEDEKIIALDLKSSLEKLGYEIVDILESGEEVIKKLPSLEIDLILMDIQLKGEMDGIRTAYLIKQNSDLPIVYLTSFADKFTLKRAQVTQPSGYLLKPFNESELNGVIEIALYNFKSGKKLKESERSLKNYKDIFDNSPIGIFQSDINGNLITANTALIKMLQYNSIDEFFKIDFANDLYFIPSEREEKVWSFLKKGLERNLEIKWKRKDGPPIWVLLNIKIINDKYGNLSYYLGFVTDINEKKTTEEELKEQEGSYKSLIESSIDAIYVIQDERLVVVNPAWEKLFGYSFAEVSKKSFNLIDILAPDYRKTYYERLEKRRKNEPLPSRYELFGITKDGEKIELEVSVTEIQWKGKPAIQGIYQDITKRKIREKQISILSKAVNQSPIIVVITDINGNIEYVNPKFTEVSGYNSEEVIGKNPRLLKGDKKSKDDYKFLWNTLLSGNEWQGEFLNRKKNGDLYCVSASICPIIDDDGKITHYIAIEEDITDRKYYEKQLILAKETAEKSDRLKSEFLAQMSHEIRTPLNNILTYISLLEEELDGNLPKGLESTFYIIGSSSQRLIRTIDLILNLAKLQTGNFETNFEKLDLDKDILYDIVLEFYSRAKAKGLELI